ncbi:MAG: hypothetical protein KKH80_00800, partial [Candidatus Omnitrophica bacterium]|nr:hypothetical protein [Candidatus Omnitrophota bacterium]
MWRILLFIFFIILFRRFSKTLEEQQQQQKEPQQDKLNELFQSWGIPLPEKATAVKPEAKAPRKLSVKKKIIIAPEAEIVELKQEIQPQFISQESGEE